MVQVGNCVSPLETDEGWLVLSHGVGPLRQYSIGALLLDRNDPSRVVGRLRRPLLVPTAEEREGYVPNVVYSCGSMIHRDRLVFSYAMSDSRTSLATVSVRGLLVRFRQEGPWRPGAGHLFAAVSPAGGASADRSAIEEGVLPKLLLCESPLSAGTRKRAFIEAS